MVGDRIGSKHTDRNIKRYVDTYEPEPEVDIKETKRRIEETNKELAILEKQLQDTLKELGL